MGYYSKYGKKYAARRLRFKNKVVILKEEIRKGICQSCGKVSKKTDIHHVEYNDNDPLMGCWVEWYLFAVLTDMLSVEYDLRRTLKTFERHVVVVL